LRVEFRNLCNMIIIKKIDAVWAVFQKVLGTSCTAFLEKSYCGWMIGCCRGSFHWLYLFLFLIESYCVML
jgi:hypothetical protein